MQDEGYIQGIPDSGRKKNGFDFYPSSHITITPKGTELAKELSDGIWIQGYGWLLSYNHIQKGDTIYLVSNPKEDNRFITIAQIYYKIKSFGRSILLHNLIEKKEEEQNSPTYTIKKPLIIIDDEESIYSNASMPGFELENARVWKGLSELFLFPKNNVTTSYNFKPQIRFNCIFEYELSVMKSISLTFSDKVVFENCEFSQVNFQNSIFEADVTFHKCKFHAEVNFQGVVFQGNAYFSESIFTQNANFSRCKFEKTVGFYSAEFKKIPNFSQAIFNANINLVNAKIDCDFKTLKEDLESSCETSSNTKQNIWYKITTTQK